MKAIASHLWNIARCASLQGFHQIKLWLTSNYRALNNQLDFIEYHLKDGGGQNIWTRNFSGGYINKKHLHTTASLYCNMHIIAIEAFLDESKRYYCKLNTLPRWKWSWHAVAELGFGYAKQSPISWWGFDEYGISIDCLRLCERRRWW